ncbi:TPA: hypothetical protein EYP70_08360 [Candidatus Bathyarchaeota archaeon]|nr:hypothetical protein [Candidatus Bathyarchaeota archaeon]
MKVRPARRGDFETIVEMSLAGPTYVKAGLKDFGTYLHLIRSIGGEVLIVEEEGDILGEAELVPQPDLSVAGPHAFLANLASIDEDRAVKRELLRACKRMAISWGFSFLDHIPFSEGLEDLEMLGFRITTAKQLLLRVAPKKIANLAKIIEEIPKNYPSNLALISGEIRPGRLAWILATRGQLSVPTKVFKIKIGRFEFISLLSKLENAIGLTFYGVPASGPGEIFNALGATMTVACDLDVSELRTLAWARYMCSFESAEFEVLKQIPLLRIRAE